MSGLKIVKIIKKLFVFLMVSVLFIPRIAFAAESTVDLGTTSSFAVLGGQTVTNTGTTTISGDAGSNVGVYPGSAIVSTGIVTSGTMHAGDATAYQARQDLQIAFNDAAGRIPTTTFVESDNQLGGKTLTTGVYRFGHADTANLTAADPLILDAQGDPNAVFIFQATSDLVFASGSVVQLINSARYCRVFWQVVSSATIGTYATFVGHIFAQTSISVQTGAFVNGQLLALTGQVSLDSNTIVNGLCPTVTPSPTPSGNGSPTPSGNGSPTPSGNATPTSSGSVTIPSTGDSGRPWFWVGLSVASLTGLIVLAKLVKRAKQYS